MQKSELIKRYLFFLVGLFVNALGVACITKANLGTSPITSVPYVLSLGFQPTIGQFTILWNLLLVACQVALLRRKFRPVMLLQVPVAALFGVFIDFSMDRVLGWLTPASYPAQAAALLIGCAVLGFGVFMEVAADVVMLPGEATSSTISKLSGREFGTVKVCVDVSMCVIAVILSLVLFQGLQGVREGTVVSALLVGFLSRLFKRWLGEAVQRLFLPQAQTARDYTSAPRQQTLEG